MIPFDSKVGTFDSAEGIDSSDLKVRVFRGILIGFSVGLFWEVLPSSSSVSISYKWFVI